MLDYRKYLFITAVLGIVLTMFLYGCASVPNHEPAIIPVSQFPSYADPDGSYVSPDSVDASIPDVDILALNDDIKSVLDQSVVGIKNPMNRLNAIVDIITARVKYDSQDDKYGTKTAIETFESGRGNCLSYSNLFVSMARYSGLQSGFQDIPIQPNWIRNGVALFTTRHIGAFVDIRSAGKVPMRIRLANGGDVTVWNDESDKFLFSPSFMDITGPEIDPFLTRPIKDNRAFAQYYNNIGSEYMAKGKPEDAYRYFVKAIETDPELAFAWSNLGVAYSRSNQTDAEEKAFFQALLISREKNDDASSMTVMSNMARLYNRTGKKEKAAYYENQVISYRDRNPYYHYSIGRIAYDESRYEESITHFKEAIQKKEDEHMFYYSLALAYVKIGDIKNAEKNLNKAKHYAWDDNVKEFYQQVLDVVLKNAPLAQKPVS
jgi:tetratricopeptide (TPR) repeat protein